MSSQSRAGWAARREGCLDSEYGEHTWAGWWACCPHGMDRSTDFENNSRCDFHDTHGQELKECANSTLVLWSDEKGYFCCDPDLYGFHDSHSSKGCVTKSTLDEGVANGTMSSTTHEGSSPGKEILESVRQSRSGRVSNLRGEISRQYY